MILSRKKLAWKAFLETAYRIPFMNNLIKSAPVTFQTLLSVDRKSNQSQLKFSSKTAQSSFVFLVWLRRINKNGETPFVCVNEEKNQSFFCHPDEYFMNDMNVFLLLKAVLNIEMNKAKESKCYNENRFLDLQKNNKQRRHH